ncbi:MAG: DEAD/DEAH box helicase [Candidatus Aminicenantes bacterium]|nr:DEAD/DEAH box helicase [Candidatus Aminicenantes bacterium]
MQIQLFENLGLNDNLLAGINDLGFTHPTPIQSQVIPHILEGERDLVALAQTGTGKTAAFGLPLVQQVSLQAPYIQALVLSPTRELCLQIARDIKSFARHIKGFKAIAIYGGASMETQVAGLKRSPHIVVATPGRLLDLMRRGKVDLSALGSLVLDEADEMLNMGFAEDLTAILAGTPSNKRTYLFSATMPREVAAIAAGYLTDPNEITSGPRNSGAENVHHVYYTVSASNRYQALKRIVDMSPEIYGIVFCRTRQETREVADKLALDGYNADALHGDLSQPQRDHVMDRFRKKNLALVVATDIAARGLDVTDLSHIINFNLPDELQNYTHRSGRTGRAGKSGTSIVIINRKETHKIRMIEKMTGKQFEARPVPDGNAVCMQKLGHFVKRIQEAGSIDPGMKPFMEPVLRELADMDKEDLIRRFISLEFKRVLEDYRHAPDLNTQETREKKDSRNKENKPAFTAMPMTRFRINVGRRHEISPPAVIGMVNDLSGKRNIQIGRIEIKQSFSIFEIDRTFEHLILKSFHNARFSGTPLMIEVAPAAPPASRMTRNIRSNGSRQHRKGPAPARATASS